MFLQLYYKYQDGCTVEEGDRIVRMHLQRNFKSILNKIKSRLEDDVYDLRIAGYTDEEIPWGNFKPHYFTPEVWESVLKYWNLPDTKKRSENGKAARKMLQCYSLTGALSYDERREV